jgi:hypothetical protein
MEQKRESPDISLHLRSIVNVRPETANLLEEDIWEFYRTLVWAMTFWM